MKKYLIIFLLFIFSCKKTEPEISQNFWQILIENNKITRVIPANNDSDFFNAVFGDENSGRSFKIEGNYLVLANNGWNLDKVLRYRIEIIGPNNIVLGLIFD